MKVLVIDDEVEFAATLCQRLKLRKYEVAEAHSGAQALKMMVEFRPDVVVLDLKMPDMSGLDVLAEIRQELPETQTIMLTGHGSSAAGSKAMEKGAFDYLMKPVEFKELLAKINEAAS